MAKFPEPPGVDALRAMPPVLHHLAEGATMTRVCFVGGEFSTSWDTFRFYGPTTSRFDHQIPDGQGRGQVQNRGIMYLGQATRLIDRNARDPVLAGFALATDLTAGPRSRAQRWAQQLYAAYPDIDGLLYCASMYGNAPAVALFERGARAIPKRPVFHRELRDAVMANILTETGRVIGYEVV